MKRHPAIEAAAGRYYSGKALEFGATARGVDWNSPESQALRFEQLLRVLPAGRNPMSLLDFGCGWGALHQHLRQSQPRRSLSYTGYDISPAQLAHARRLFRGPHARFVSSLPKGARFDFAVASGVFNVRQDIGTRRWEAYVLDTLDELAARARHGFAFNMLTAHSDRDRMRRNLYYADPGRMLNHCIRRFSRHTALLHDYGLYEFTLLVKQSAPDLP